MRIFVTQLVETERAALGNLDRPRERFGNRGIAAGDLIEGTQVALGVREEPRSGFGERALLANARQHVLQISPLGNVVVHVVGGDERDAGAAGQLAELSEPDFVGQVVSQLGSQVKAVGKDLAIHEQGIEGLRD